MAVATDATFASDSNPQASPFDFVSNAGNQVTGTVSASATVLIAGAYFDGDVATVGTVTMTWDQGGSNQSMTAIGSGLDITGGFSLFMFGLKNPTSGNKTLRTSWTGAGSHAMASGGITFTGSDTSGTGWSNNGSDTGSASPATSTVTTTTGGMAVVFSLTGSAAATMTIQNGTTAWIDNNSAPNNIGYDVAAATRADNSGSTVVSWTLSAGANWGNLKVNIPATAASTAQNILLARYP